MTPINPSTGLNALLNETGKIYLSVDGNGTDSSTETIQVLKNLGATVRTAYLIGDGTNSIGTGASVNGTAITWDRIESTPWRGGNFYSYFSDVTSLVKSTIDAAAAGTLNIAVNEGSESSSYEGLALAVVFDDPNQTDDQSVILYFGGLSPRGGTATINFASPVNTSSNLEATLGLGIGYSYNSGTVATQSSQVKVNGQLLTQVAGNYDDGQGGNEALFTAGGLGDSPNNPSPSSIDITTDDELYNLLPFIKNGDTSITLNTVNSSNDDHIFFAHLTLKGITGTDSINVVQLAVEPGSVNEDGTANLAYIFTRTGATTNPLTVTYTVAGTAEVTTDYTQTGASNFTATTGTVTFAAGSATATVTVKPIADTVVEPNETVSLTLISGSGYAVGTSTSVIGTIIDNAPPTNIILSNSNIEENKAIGAIIGDLAITDPDLGNTFTYSLVTGTGATDNSLFTISNNQLKANAVFDYETKNSYSIQVRATDQGGLFYEKQLVIGVTNVNETPTNITLPQSTVEENQAIGIVVGNLNTNDPDAGNTFTYSLVTGAGATDNSLFTISNNQLKTNAVFDYETKNSYSVRVQTTDQEGLFFDKQLIIGVVDVNENQVFGDLSFSSPQFSVNEDGTSIAAVTVTRTGGTDGAVSATVNFKDGTAKAPSDYNNTSIIVNFADGETSKTVTIPIVNDDNLEPDETLQLFLSNPTGGVTISQENSATLTIVDKNAPLITGFPQRASGSNKGQTTIVIAGQNFSPTDQISLVDSDGTEKAASKVYWVNETEAWATFDLQGLSTGKYDVKVNNELNSFVSNDSFTVTDGSLGNIQVQLSYPSRGVATLTYTNVGQTDVIAPLFRISPTNAQVTFPEENTVSASLRQLLNLNLGTSTNGPAGILAPGEQGQFSFNYTPNGNGLISFAVEQVKPDEVINWANIKAESRADYSFIDAAGWDALWSNLTDTLGQTAGQFQTVMAENANYLSQLGEQTNDLTRLFAFEWKQEANTLTNVDLLSTTDVVDAASGLSLTFNRTFFQSIAERYNLGSLGRGWASQWDLRATTDSKGNVVIRSVGDLQRVFEKQTNGTYTEYGGATLTITNGEYRLKEADGIVSLFGSDGKLSYVEDPNGNRITLEYTNNLLTKLVHTNGDSLTLAYTPQGRISQITDSTGQVSSYSYDASGENLLSVTTPQGTTTYTYDTGNVAAKKYSLLSVTSDLGYQRSFEYDDQGRLIKEFSNGETQTLTYSYDTTGGVTITDNTGASQTILLDDRGNGGQIRGVNNQNLLFSYDADGNLIGATLPNGGQTAYSYDKSGNLINQTNLLNQDVKFTYDVNFNQLTGFTDPKGNGVGYSYDANSNLTKITYADGSNQQFSVDALGNITSYVNRRGNTIQYTYDKDGQLTQKKFADGSSVTYGYDTKGNLTSVTDRTETITLEYDAANQLTLISYPTGRSLQYTYNADGQRTKLVSQDGYTVNYGYDAVGRLTSLTDATGEDIISYEYDNAGRLTKETNGNGTYTTYEYDQQNQLTRLSNYKVDNTVNSRFEYAYDNLGRRTSMTTLEGTFEYGYDATGQLTSVVTPDNRTIRYQYDAAGNRIAVTDNETGKNYTSNNLNQYTIVGNAVYTYDTDGNLISKTEGGQTSTYTYDAENRLVKVVTPDGTWDYQYDGLGNRVATVLNGKRTEYLLDPLGLGDVVGEYNGSDLVANYTHGIGLVNRVNGSNINYYDADAIGSTVGLTGTDGSYVNRYSYLPFGEDLTKVEGVANPFEYVGQWGVMDEGNGLDFMRARFYDSGLGRFKAADPIELNGRDTNFYRYVGNNPILLIDPSGLRTEQEIYPSKDPNYYLNNLNWVNDTGYLDLEHRTNPVTGKKDLLYSFRERTGWWPWNWTNTGQISFYKDGHIDYSTDKVGVYGPNFLFDLYIYPWIIHGSTDLLPHWGKQLWNWGSKVVNQAGDYLYSKPLTLSGGTWNDPHLQTLDGLNYDFQSVREFTLIKSITDDFEIQTRQQPWFSSTSVSTNTAVAIKIDGQRIAFYANQAQPLLINGIATKLGEGQLYAIGQNLITREGDRYNIITANNDLIQISDRGSFLNINLGLADNRQGKVVGLLGNFNENGSDEFALRDKTVIGGSISNQQLYGDYAASWRITQATSLFDYAPGQDTNTFTDLAFPQNVVTAATLTPEQRAAAEQIARDAGITDPDVLEDVILDIFITNGDPQFIQGAITQQRLETVSAPNTLINPDGFGTQNWLTAGAVIPYAIRFSNNANQGTTPIAQVSITQQLDSDLDLNTFTLDDFGFGEITVDVPLGVQNYSQRLDLRSTRNVFVDVNAELHTATGVVTWTFTAIDPSTGNAANSTNQGFLPPNDQNGVGSGFVGYSVQAKANSTNSSRVDAQANIVFNSQTPIQTTAVFNTLDSDIPTNKVNTLPVNSSSNFTVSWTGSDTGSALAFYDIFVSTDGGEFIPWQVNTTATSAIYNGETGRNYTFYSVATDNLGQREVVPTQPDTVTTTTTLAVNNAPTVQQAIIDQIATEDTNFTFTIPDNTFSDVDAGDILTYSATLENGNSLPSWLTFDPVTRTFKGGATNSEVGSVNITVSAIDTSDATATDDFTLAVNNTNDAPTLDNAIADQIAKEDTAFSFTFDANTFSDIDAGDGLSYSVTLKDGSNLPSWLKFNPVTRTFSGTPANANVGNLTIEVRATDNDGVSATDTFLLAVESNNGSSTFKLSKIADDIFNISNSSDKSKLQVTLTTQSSNLVNELGVFTVDDAQGKIQGIAPGAAGYAEAALDRAQVIFSAITNLPNGFNTNALTHLLEFNSGDNLRFYLVKNSSTDAVRAGVTPTTDILFSDPLRQKITDLGIDEFSLAWKDGSGNSNADFQDLVVKVKPTNDLLPLGTNLQGKPQSEVIDLRDVTSQVKADFTVNREAAFNNFIGFYLVADENGGIDTNSDGKADILAAQAGYTEAAVRGRVAGIDLTVNNQGTATYTGTFQPGSIFAPFIIANGGLDGLLDSNSNNDPAVYFPFLGANIDKVDHIRLLGNNIFGFEDLPDGGDNDFNDVIVGVNLSIV
ncbi:putative Ig domain-containing protein [Nostoc sp. LPT]|uniref:putative Ig domain-containing protein n=1 Tax=Nostoc sp. LPT TaxID=2815387 RepID=UPI0025CDDD74|nr:putative Ig domain-containing protein [Nostoc sp. LPT]